MFIKCLIICSTILLSGCTTYSSGFQGEVQEIPPGLVKSEACAHYLFGVKIPYIGDTSIRLSGSESLAVATKKGKIVQPVIVDSKKVNWVLYNEKCVIVFGK